MVQLEDCVTRSRSKWFEGPVGWVLSRPKRLRDSSRLKGQLRLFDPLQQRCGESNATTRSREEGAIAVWNSASQTRSPTASPSSLVRSRRLPRRPPSICRSSRRIPASSCTRSTSRRDPHFWSVRVSLDVRLIVHRSGTSLLLCYVNHHDAAVPAGPRRRKLETHPARPARRNPVEARETVQDVIVPTVC